MNLVFLGVFFILFENFAAEEVYHWRNVIYEDLVMNGDSISTFPSN